MAIPALRKRIVRCWVDVTNIANFIDVIAGGVPKAFNNASVELQIAFGYGPEANGELVDVSDLSSLLAKIWLNADDYLDVVADYIDAELTIEEWNERASARTGRGKAAHAVFTFSALDFSFDLNNQDAITLKLTIHGDTTDEPSEPDVWGKSDITIIDAGLDSTAGTRQASNIIPNGAAYDGSGEYTLNGLTIGRGYRWTQGDNDDSVTNDAETVEDSNAVFFAQATSVTLNGSAGQPVTAVVWYPASMTADEMKAYLAQFGGQAFSFIWLKSKDSANYYKVRIAEQDGVPMINIDETSATTDPT